MNAEETSQRPQREDAESQHESREESTGKRDRAEAAEDAEMEGPRRDR